MTLKFGIFELDQAAGELRRSGQLVRLAPQPFQVLRLLVESAGEVVDRDRLRQEIWGETAVDFDRSLNVCIAQIRSALKDDAESPRFVQTLPRRGYRFVAAVETADVPVTPAPPIAGPGLRMAVAACVAVSAIAVAGLGVWRTDDAAVRIAILPFDTLEATGENNPQIDGLFDELLTRIGGVQPERLRVIGRRSVARFRNERRPILEIGERLNVRYVVEGTVRAEGGRLRVTARLAQADNEAVLWSESFAQDGEAAAFEEEFVARVSAAVLTKLFPGGQAAERATGCRDGWESYRMGRLLANRGTIADLRKSLSYFEQAGCAASKAGLAESLTRLARLSPHKAAWWERARSAAREALASSSETAGAHVTLGNIAFWFDWDWKNAEREFHTSLRLNPSDADAHHDFAWLLMAVGRKAEALASLQRAMALDPLSARVTMDAGWLLLQAGRFRESAAHARRALELDPEMSEARACLSRALMYAGDERGAIEALREGRDPAVAAKEPGEALRMLLRESLGGTASIDPYQRAWRLAWLGAREEALAELEEGHRRRSSMMPMMAVDPAFASLRNDARFQKIVREMGL